eukprot:12925112-Prorocentrum_lima.AAC.1
MGKKQEKKKKATPRPVTGRHAGTHTQATSEAVTYVPQEAALDTWAPYDLGRATIYCFYDHNMKQ